MSQREKPGRRRRPARAANHNRAGGLTGNETTEPVGGGEAGRAEHWDDLAREARCDAAWTLPTDRSPCAAHPAKSTLVALR